MNCKRNFTYKAGKTKKYLDGYPNTDKMTAIKWTYRGEENSELAVSPICGGVYKGQNHTLKY